MVNQRKLLGIAVLCAVLISFSLVYADDTVSTNISASSTNMNQTATKKNKKKKQKAEKKSSSSNSSSNSSISSSDFYSGANPSEIRNPGLGNIQQSLDPNEVIMKIDSGNQAVQKINTLNSDCGDCNTSDDTVAGVDRAKDIERKFQAKGSNDEGTLTTPLQDQNNNPERSSMCGTRTGNYDVCIYDGDVVPSTFKFTNKGPDNIVSPAAEGKMREWQFYYEGKARQDLGFSISDSPDGSASKTQETYMMVFPRKYLPAIRIDGNKQIVTLPTGETVTYDLKTKEIIGGVLAEKKLDRGPAQVSYSGNGVIVRVDREGEEARYARSSKATATINKQGKTCKVPVKSLWPDQTEHSAFHFKFATDEDFDAFLKQKCHFSIN